MALFLPVLVCFQLLSDVLYFLNKHYKNMYTDLTSRRQITLSYIGVLENCCCKQKIALLIKKTVIRRTLYNNKTLINFSFFGGTVYASHNNNIFCVVVYTQKNMCSLTHAKTYVKQKQDDNLNKSITKVLDMFSSRTYTTARNEKEEKVR